MFTIHINQGGNQMSTMFGNIEEAKAYAAFGGGVDLRTTIFEEVEGLQAADMGAQLLDDPGTSKEVKQEIRDRLNAQKAFKFTNCKGIEVTIVIGPFREGYDLWIIGPQGQAIRL
ncbi:hypothetical protein L6279_02380 [Candidatus Parcubacteria bacterium]|nr:hypothetical protein [Candidatus Parcubacteria bacterium]